MRNEIYDANRLGSLLGACVTAIFSRQNQTLGSAKIWFGPRLDSLCEGVLHQSVQSDLKSPLSATFREIALRLCDSLL
jgi:hypothetical protein